MKTAGQYKNIPQEPHVLVIVWGPCKREDLTVTQCPRREELRGAFPAAATSDLRETGAQRETDSSHPFIHPKCLQWSRLSQATANSQVSRGGRDPATCAIITAWQDVYPQAAGTGSRAEAQTQAL